MLGERASVGVSISCDYHQAQTMHDRMTATAKKIPQAPLTEHPILPRPLGQGPKAVQETNKAPTGRPPLGSNVIL